MQDFQQPPGLRCHVEHDGDAVIVRPVGEVDIATAPAISQALDAIHADGGGPVLLDLRAVSFMDSTGLRLVIREHQRAGADGGLRVDVGRGSEVHRLLELTGMLDLLPIRVDG
jgi:anti-sigma B factor antagonist